MTEYGKSFVGDIKIQNGKITDDPNFIAEKVIDASNMICMPSLVNAHTHSSMELMRNYKDTAPDLMSWLSEIFPIEDKLIDEDIYWASKLACAEMIQSGCTVFNDMYFKIDNTCNAVIESKMRANIGLTLFGGIEDTKERFISHTKIAEEYSIKGNGQITFSVAPHAIYTTTAQSYKYGRDWLVEHGGSLHTHMSETKTEYDNCLKEHRKTPLRYLESTKTLDDISVILAHGVYLTDDELTICRDRGISVVHNPSSNCKLASGIAPIAKMKNMGVNVALGTDGSSSNNNQNMFEEMHLAAMLSSVSNMNPMATTPYSILEMATIGGAKALGLDKQIGTLEVGKDADLILIDTHKAHLTPLNDPFSALVYAAQGCDVDTVFSRGNILMENKILTTLNLDEIISNTNKCWSNLLKRGN